MKLTYTGAPAFGATNEPETCLWCGRKLHSHRHAIKGGLGAYGDDAFCGLRCGYHFGVAFAGFGKRLKPREND